MIINGLLERVRLFDLAIEVVDFKGLRLKVHNHVKKIMALIEAGHLRPGGLYRTDIAHDDDCPFLAHVGECICDPDVELTEVATTEEQTMPRNQWIALRGRHERG